MTSTESPRRAGSANGQVSADTVRARKTRAQKGRETDPPTLDDQTRRSQAEAGAAPVGPAEPGTGWTFRDFLVPYILLAISIQRAHGYFIEQYLRGLGLVNVEMSTLYRTLRQMEKDGLVYSQWEPGPEGPARRIYGLTEAGRWWLDAGAAALDGYRTLIDRFFGSYSNRGGRS